LNILELEFLHRAIEEKLSDLIEPHTLLHEAARYSLLAPGKRLRPLLTIITAQALGASLGSALAPACAIEMVHTYSLIHDDLPCMDDDDFRRGQPSLHKAYSEGHAVLTGDYLLTLAFQILSESPGLTAEQQMSLVRFLSLRAGDTGMIGGQVLDIASQGREIDWETLHRIHLGKTAALITVALEFGGIIANASTDEMYLLNRAGKNLGLAFQLVDDLLDSAAEEETWTNTLSHMSRENVEAEAQSLLANAHAALSELPYPIQGLQSIAEKFVYRKF
jgi:geranylgeranyl diphosphate synthase, type II